MWKVKIRTSKPNYSDSRYKFKPNVWGLQWYKVTWTFIKTRFVPLLPRISSNSMKFPHNNLLNVSLRWDTCDERLGNNINILCVLELSINLQFYYQKTDCRINWNGYILFSKNFDCDLWRSFDGRFHGIHWPEWHSTSLARSLSISAVLFGFYPPAQANF